MTSPPTIADKIDQANPQDIADALRKIGLGKLLTPLKRAITGATASATFDLTATDFDNESTGAANENRLPLLACITLRVTASGTAGAVGSYILTDTGGTAIVPPGGASAAVGIAKISDDGKTITFPNTVTAFVIEYIPRVGVVGADITAEF